MMYTDCKMGNNGNIQNHLPKNGGNQMVKGVNRRIVEIKNTNSEYFEKCILYVREDMKSVPFDFLTSHRCKEAKKLLKAGSTVSEAANSCGFKNLSFFSKTYKNIMGNLPIKDLKN